MTRFIQEGDHYLLRVELEEFECMGVTIDTPVAVRSQRGLLVVEPQSESRQNEIATHLKDIDAKYGKVLKKLAE